MKPPARGRAPRRWQCGCGPLPFLFATTDAAGVMTIKVRDRLYQIEGRCDVKAICPRCGRTHRLTLSPRADAD